MKVQRLSLLISAVVGVVSGQTHAPAALPPV